MVNILAGLGLGMFILGCFFLIAPWFALAFDKYVNWVGQFFD